MSEHNPVMSDNRLVACSCGVRYRTQNPDDEHAEHMTELDYGVKPTEFKASMWEALAFGAVHALAGIGAQREMLAEVKAKRYAHCPGCGDTGDVEHVAACVKARMVRRAHVVSPYEAAIAVVEAACKQLNRRGQIHVTSLVDMVTARWGAR